MLDRILDVTEGVLWIGLLVFGSLIALAAFRGDSSPALSERPTQFEQGQRMLEAESLKVLGKSREFGFWLQPTADFSGGRWSSDGHMFAFGTQIGDWIEFELAPGVDGTYQVVLFLTRAADYGILGVTLNGERVGGEIDLYSNLGVVPAEPVDLGPIELEAEANVLRIMLEGSNPGASAPHFQFGIDGVQLAKP